MSTLGALQRQFAAYLLSGEPGLVESVRATAQADGPTRLGVYAHAYRQRLHDVLAEEYPALAAMAGAERFAGWTSRYAQQRPSRDPNIRWFGAGLADWLRAAEPDLPAAAAMAGFEWTLSTAFDARDIPALDATRLAALPAASWPGLCLAPHRQLTLLPIAWNLDAIRGAVDAGHPPPPLTDTAATLAIWRWQRRVRYRRLDADEAIALDLLGRRLPFGALCEALAAHHGAAAAARAAQWLRDWLEAGWIGDADVAG